MIINLGSKYRKHKEESQATATRPLAIQKDGTWFTYGYDITKNVCEVFGPAGYIRTAYSYAPFGNVTESGDVSQPFQWSSEHYDSELLSFTTTSATTRPHSAASSPATPSPNKAASTSTPSSEIIQFF